VSKFLGPDMCLAVTPSDPDTAERLARRLNPGSQWVSHLLQRLGLAQLTDPRCRRGRRAGATTRAQPRRRRGALRPGVPVVAGDG
jgi:hypothetical protein